MSRVQVKDHPDYFIEIEPPHRIYHNDMLVNESRPCPYIRVFIDGKSLYKHHIVAKTFIENIEQNELIDHIDRDKTNNSKYNLRWINHSSNGLNRNGKWIDKLSNCSRKLDKYSNKRNTYILDNYYVDGNRLYYLDKHNGFRELPINYLKNDPYSYVVIGRNKKIHVFYKYL